MSRENRFNMHGGKKLTEGFLRDPAAAEFVKGAPQGHRGARFLPLVFAQPANPLALLAEVHQVKEKAEGVRHVSGVAKRQAVDGPALGLDKLPGWILSDLL